MIKQLYIFTISFLITFYVYGEDNGKKYTPGSELNFGEQKIVEEYLGIPFAKPPINERRFKAPEKVDEPTSPFKAEYPAATCPQHFFKTNITALDFWNPPNNISEDCLQLNMWVPKTEKKKPILVNLCGGGYWRLGASNDIFNGSVLAAYSQAIVVNLNFRLGALGFARFADSKVGINGNMGLLDQQMGLQWIQKNIEKFGGDKNNVTLIGEQTGATSAAAHLYAEGSKNLFKRLALTSGSFNTPWTSKENSEVEKSSRKLADLLGCTQSEKEKLECLQSKNYSEILDKTDDIRKENFSFTYPFLPVNDDGVFFNKSLLRRILVKKNADILMGDTTHEGSFFLWYYYKNLINCTSLKLTKDEITDDCIVNKTQFENIVDNVTRVFGYVEEKKKTILNYYSVTDFNATEAAQLFLSSVLYDCGLKHFADDLVEETNVKKLYVYMFNHRSSEKKTSWPDSFGTVHSALIEFLFGRPFRYPENYDSTKIETEKKMSEIVMKLYSKFAYEGKPNNDEWKQYTKSDEFVISLDSEYTEYLDQYDISHLKECDIIMPKLKRESRSSKKIQIYNN